LNDRLGHNFTFAPTTAWRMDDSAENEVMLRLYPAETCVEGFCASCNLYLIVDLRYSREQLPWDVVQPCDDIRTDNNKHPRDATRNYGRALVWGEHHGFTKMLAAPAGERLGPHAPRMRWYAPSGIAETALPTPQ